MKTKPCSRSRSFLGGTLLMIAAVAAPLAGRGQSDNFNSGNASAWTNLDLSAAGLPPSSYNFPPDGSGGYAYRIFSPALPVPDYGPARAYSYRTNVYADFEASVDLVAWDDSLSQAFGLLARLSNIGLGQNSGYAFTCYSSGGGTGLDIYRLKNETSRLIATTPLTLNPTHRYRLVATGAGSMLMGKIYDQSDLTNPLATVFVNDETYTNGVFGVFNYANLGNADVTYDNYSAQALLAPSIFIQPQSQAVGPGTTATFNVTATGAPPLTYQWLAHGTNLADNVRITGSQSNLLTVSNVLAGDVGTYQVVITNTYGAVTSASAMLTLLPPIVVYYNGFEGVVGPEWSTTKTSNTPLGPRKFLGDFGNETVTLSLTNLPPHEQVTVGFDLFLIRSWDGIDTLNAHGPDVWDLSASGGLTLLHTTFSNTGPLGERQAYPGTYPGGDYPAQTGAAETNSLGYTFDGDTVYHLSFSFSHSSNFLSLQFSGTGLEVITNESWGLDNVYVRVDSNSPTNWTWNGSADADWFNPSNWAPAGVPSTNDTVNFAGGTINLTTPLAFSGQFNWSGGTFSGAPLTIGSNGTLIISGGVTLYNALTNVGTVALSGGGSLSMWNDNGGRLGSIYNLAGGLFDMQNDGTVGCACSCCSCFCYGNEFFMNAGTVRKSASTGTTTIGIPFYNLGAVSVMQGTVSFNNGGTIEGTFSAGAATAINFNGGSFSSTQGALLSGSGSIHFTGGNLALLGVPILNLPLTAGTVSLGPGFEGGTITNFTLVGSTLASAGIVSGVMYCTAGTVAGPLTVLTNGVLNITGGVTLYNALTNAGSVVLSGGGSLSMWNDNGGRWGAVYNLAGGVFDIQNDGSVSCACSVFNCFCYGHELFNNAGTVRKSAGTGTTIFGIPFYNSGLVEADTGVIAFQVAFSESSSATLANSIAGTAPRTMYGQIAFSTPLDLAGTFTVSMRGGFRPAPGNTFQLLSYLSVTHAFSCMSGLDLGAGLRLQPQFTDTSLGMVAVAYVTNSRPQLFIARAPNGLMITWPQGFPGWVLKSTTNLTSPFWSPVPLACDSQASVPITAPSQFFRLSQ